MAGSKFDLSLVVRALDRASGPLRKIAQHFSELTDSKKEFGKAWKDADQALGLSQMGKALGGFGGAMRNIGSQVFSLGARFAALGAGAGYALYSIIHGTVAAGDDLATLAERVGMGVDAFASLRYAADQNDVDQDKFNKSMDYFAKSVGEAKAGTGALVTILQKVSPTLLRQVKAAKTTEGALSIMTDAFVRIEDPTKRAALANAAFGRSGLQMGTFLHTGAPAIQALQRRYLDLAGSQAEFANRAGDADNATKDLDTAFEGLRNVVVGKLFPAFTQLTKSTTDFVVKNRDRFAAWAQRAGDAVQRWVDSGGFERLVDGLGKIASAVGSVIDFLGPFGTAAAAAAVAMGPLIASIVTAIPAVYSLGVALLTTPVGWVLLAVAAIAGSVFLIYKNWGPIKSWWSGLWDGISLTIYGAKEMLLGLMHLDFGRVMRGWVENALGLESIFKHLVDLLPLLIPGGTTFMAAKGAYNWLSGGAASPGGAMATPVAPVSGTQRTEARVSVDFSNLPRGARVTQDPTSSQPVDLNMSVGPAMVLP